MENVENITPAENEGPEINIDTNDKGQPYMIDCLSDPNHSRLGPNKKYEDLLYIVNHFRIATLGGGETERARHTLFGRRALYNEVAGAFKIAQTLLHSSNRQHMKALLEECGMIQQAEKFIKRTGTNYWAYACALLYGEWEEKTNGNDSFLEFDRKRSAEKYGNVMRHLFDNQVKADAAAMYIETFRWGKYARLQACEKADRAKYAKNKNGSTSKQHLKHEKNFILRGESTANADVFYAAKPDDLPETVQYGQAYFKVFGSKMLIVGYEAWEEEKYKKHVITRGRKFKKAEDAVRDNDKKKREETSGSANAVSANIKHDDSVHTLLASGVCPEEIVSAMKKAAADLLAQKAAS